MRIAIFSDIHGNEQALMSILCDIKSNNIDKIYCLGDVIAIGPSPKECLDLIINNDVNMVLGNHELYYLLGTQIDDEMSINEKKHQKWVSDKLDKKHRDFLKSCQLKLEEEIDNKCIVFQHFLFNEDKNDMYPFDDLKIIKDKTINSKVDLLTSDITFIGHEHDPFEVISKNKKIIDVGSSGCTMNEITFYTILSIKGDRVKIEKKYLIYDRDSFENKYKKIKYPEKEKLNKLFFGVDL